MIHEPSFSSSREFLKPLRRQLGKNVIYPVVIFFVALLPRIINLNWGLNTDEMNRIIYGVQYFDNWLNTSFWPKMKNYPPAVELLIGLSVKLLTSCGVDILVASRVPVAILGALACVIVYSLGRELFNEKVGLLSASILIFDPVFLASSRIVWFDVPMTLFTSLAILYFYRGTKASNRWSQIYFVVSGAFCALATPKKYYGVLTLVALLTWVIITRTIKTEDSISPIFTKAKGLILFFIAYSVTFMISWPLLWLPNKYFIKVSVAALQEYFRYGHTQFFMGQTYNFVPPYYYLILLVGVTTPIEFAAFIAGLTLVITWAIRRQLTQEKLLITTCFIVFLCAISAFPIKNTRYLTIISPQLAILSAIGLLWIANVISNHLPLRKYSISKIGTVTTFLLMLHVISTALAHPYYGLYFSPIVGGPNNVVKIYQVGNGEGLREASLYILQNSHPGDRIAVFGHAGVVRHYVPSLTVKGVTEMSYATFMRGHYNYIIFQIDFIQRYNDHQLWEAFKNREPIHIIVINGFPMVYIYRI